MNSDAMNKFFRDEQKTPALKIAMAPSQLLKPEFFVDNNWFTMQYSYNFYIQFFPKLWKYY